MSHTSNDYQITTVQKGVFWGLLYILLCVLPAHAEEQAIVRLRQGWTEFEVRDEYGEPEKADVNHSAVSTWHYGPAVVFFTGGKVTAWSDAGHLAALAKKRRHGRRPEQRWSAPGINTQQEADKVLDELVEEMH